MISKIYKHKSQDWKLIMKNLRKITGVTALLILVFMVIALFRFQREEEASMLPDQVEYLFNEDWTLTTLKKSSILAQLVSFLNTLLGRQGRKI